MRYQVTYPVAGSNALKTDAPRRQPSSGRIIPFPGNPRAARTSELRLVDRDALRNWKAPAAGGSARSAASGAVVAREPHGADSVDVAGVLAGRGSVTADGALTGNHAMMGAGTCYVPARHLFYWMTDETSPKLHAKHACRLSPARRRLCYYADRVRNAVVNYPFVVQLRFGTPGAYDGPKPSALQVVAFLVGACTFACVLAMLGR